ncbi:cytochrome P450 [Mycena olivaceomarginata]|nr:cytochrome P450 [Mycena olivaceomarginata]
MTLLLLVALVAICAAIVLKIGSREKGLPPGPPTVPVLGNAYIFPTEFSHYKYVALLRIRYSLNVWYLQIHGVGKKIRWPVFGNDTVVVLTDAAAVKEFDGQRSSTTVDRPPSYVGELITGGLHMMLARFSYVQLSPAAHNILHSPQSFYTEIQRYSMSVIYSVLHGGAWHNMKPKKSTGYIAVMHEWSALLEPGAVPPVDAIPILKRIPERWAKWKRDCKRVRDLQRARYFGLLEDTRERMRRKSTQRKLHGAGLGGTLLGCNLVGAPVYETDTVLEGGADTTTSYIQSLVLALVAYPEAQKKAHEELDRMVGEHRNANSGRSRTRCPYIRAIISETHRFRPIAPLGAPHATLATEEYNGYIIPKGTTIFVNISLFDNPEEFIPERYLLSENGTKPGVDGKRLETPPFLSALVAPEFYSTNLNVMNLLWAFDFKSDIDTNGDPIPVDTFAYRKVGNFDGTDALQVPHHTPRTAAKARIIENEFLKRRTYSPSSRSGSAQRTRNL